jgi:GT2 family glycosyltransferase
VASPSKRASAGRLVSVVVPNWNGSAFLGECLSSLERQTYPRVERIVVDDASTDESCSLVRNRFRNVGLVRLARRGGFARAANAGMRAARGDVIALLNNDAVAEPEWVAELLAAFDRHPDAGSVASKILLQTAEPRFHSAGDVFPDMGTPNSRGARELDCGQYDDEERVFGACGGAAAYRREMLDRIGLFDERFVMYCEDVDLAFRARATGYACVYAPRAVVRHRLGASAAPELASYLCGRNFLWLLARDVPVRFLWRHWLDVLRGHCGIVAEAARHAREPASRARLQGIVAGIRTAALLSHERRAMEHLT